VLDEMSASNGTTSVFSNACNYQPDSKQLSEWSDFTDSLKDMAALNDSQKACTAEYFKPYGTETMTVQDTLEAFSILVYAFSMHSSAINVFDNLKNRSPEKMAKTLRIAMLLITMFYLIIGIFGYLTWYNSTIADILLPYAKTSSGSILIFLGRVGVINTVLVSYLLLAFNNRTAFWRALKSESQSDVNEESEYLKTENSQVQDAAENFEYFSKDYWIKQVGYNFVLYALVLLIVVAKADSLKLLLWISGTYGGTLCYMILPGITGLLTFNNIIISDESKNINVMKWLSWAVLIFGLFLAVFQTFLKIKN